MPSGWLWDSPWSRISSGWGCFGGGLGRLGAALVASRGVLEAVDECFGDVLAASCDVLARAGSVLSLIFEPFNKKFNSFNIIKKKQNTAWTSLENNGNQWNRSLRSLSPNFYTSSIWVSEWRQHGFKLGFRNLSEIRCVWKSVVDFFGWVFGTKMELGWYQNGIKNQPYVKIALKPESYYFPFIIPMIF